MEYTPKQLSDLSGIKYSTVQRYLTDEDFFSPVRRNSNNHRFYDEKTLKKLKLVWAMKGEPFRRIIRESKAILSNEAVDIDVLDKKLKESPESMLFHLRDLKLVI